MRPFLIVAAIGVALWWLSRRKPAIGAQSSNQPNGTAPNANGDAFGIGPGVPDNVPNAYNPADDRNNDPVVKIAMARGLDSSVIPVPTLDEAVARSSAAATAADTLLALASTYSGPQLSSTPTGLTDFWGRPVAGPGAQLTADSITWNAQQQASVAANPYYASLGYNGNAAEVAGQAACGAKSSGNPLGRVLDQSFCEGGPHYGGDAALSTGSFP